MNYYAISDIHGYLDILKETLRLIDLDKGNMLIMLGDYIDYGNKSLEVLLFIKNIQEKYKDKVIILKGNHEEYFLEWLFNPKDYINYFNLELVKEFLDDAQIVELNNKNEEEKSIYTSSVIKKDYKDLIKWLKELPYYYETDKQIYVHAGIDEESNNLWKVTTSNDIFTMKYPIEEGYFYKDIIAGHIGTASIRKNNDNSVYWDKKSHFYIDGTTIKSKIIPVLKYSTVNNKYTSFYKENNKWIEYVIK